MTGYRTREYANSLAEFGQPRELAAARGFFLERPIGDTELHDGMSCYPLFRCGDWNELAGDLRQLEDHLVSFTAVVVPFDDCDEAPLVRAFPDRLVPFKEHFVIEFPGTPESFANRHHRYYARRALRDVIITPETEPARLLPTWLELYGELIRRHELRGIHAFSPQAFAQQLSVPGIVAFRATAGDETVAAHLWYIDGPVAYSHLMAASPRGYELNAAYALYWRAIEFFADKVLWLDLGGGAGAGEKESGLTFFKRGWATGTRPALLGGRVLNRSQYERLTEARGATNTNYFPSYRAGEF